MEKVVNSDVAKELLMVLSYCDNDFIEKIPKDVLVRINDLAADSNKNFYINVDKDLDDQDLSDECMDLLSELYFNYMINSSSKRELVSEIVNNLDNL